MNIKQIKAALMSNNFDVIDEEISGIEELYDNGSYDEAEAYANTLLKLTTKKLGNNNNYILDLLEVLGGVYTETSRFSLAEQTYRKILNTPIILTGLVPYQHAFYNQKLGYVLYRLNKYSQALPLLDKSKAMYESLPANYRNVIADIDIIRASLMVELGNPQKGWETFLIANMPKALYNMDEAEAYLSNQVGFAEHLMKVDEYERAEPFLKGSIESALDYHKRISEFLVRAFRVLSEYHRHADPGKSGALMQRSCDLVKHLAIVQSYAMDVSGSA